MTEVQDYIAVVGSGVVFPDASNEDIYWNNILNKKSCLSIAPSERWNYKNFFSKNKDDDDKGYSALGGYIKNFHFNRSQFGIGEKEALSDIHRMEKWLLTAFDKCIENVKNPNNSNSHKIIIGATGVNSPAIEMLFSQQMKDDFEALGIDINDEQQNIKELADIAQKIDKLGHNRSNIIDWTLLNCVKNVAEKVGLSREETFLIDAACSSSLFCVEVGINYLNDNTADVVYCGGLSRWSEIGQVLFSKLGGLSDEGLYSFDKKASGTLFGDGAGVIALKKLSKAKEDGDEIHGIIRGIGIASDGKGKAIYAPNSKGQTLAIDRAYQSTKIKKDTIQYVEAHATGTPVGDLTEISSLIESFNGIPQDEISLGSVKSLFGHLGWAAGIASITKILLSFKNSTMPPQTNYETLNPEIDLENSPFYIQTEKSNWEANKKNLPRRAAINGFGFGGTNGHMILEEYLESYHKNASINKSNKLKESVVLIDVGAIFPGIATFDQLKKILAADINASIDNQFNDTYNIPNISFRILPKTARVTDVAYFQVLDAAKQIVSKYKDLFDNYKKETGVIIGHMDALDKTVDCYQRVHYDNLRAHIEKSNFDKLSDELKIWHSEICSEIAVTTEDSFPGIMPNVLSGRICNYFDFQGLNYCIDNGFSSLITGIDLACKSIQSGTSKIVLAGAVNTANHSCFTSMISGKYGSEFGLKQGTALVMLMGENLAKEHNLPILGKIDNCNNKSRLNIKQNNRRKKFNPGWMGLTGGMELIKSVVFSQETLIQAEDDASLIFIPDSKETKKLNGSAKNNKSDLAPFLKDDSVTSTGFGIGTLVFTQSFKIFNELALKTESSAVIFYDLTNNEYKLRNSKNNIGHDVTEEKIIESVLTDNLMQIVSIFDFDEIIENERFSIISNYWAFLDSFYQHNYSEIRKQNVSIYHVFIDILSNNKPVQPGIGLFTGLSKSFSNKQNKISTIVVDESNLKEIISLIPKEKDSSDLEVQYKKRERYIQEFSNNKAITNDLVLDEQDVVLVVGGAKGSTFDFIEIHSRSKNPVFICLGNISITDDLHNDNQDLDFDEFSKRSIEYNPENSIDELKRDYIKYENTKEIKKNILLLKERNNRSEYITCNLNSANDVKETLNYIKTRYKNIDVVVYGTEDTDLTKESKPTKITKDLLDDKIIGLTNLIKSAKEPLAEKIVLLGSGKLYGPINDFMDKFSNYFNNRQNQIQFSYINRCEWNKTEQAINLADSINNREYFIPLNRENGNEFQKNRKYFVDSVIRESDEKIIIQKALNTEKDIFLKDHTAGGDCVMAGTFSMEIAVEAALELAPGLKVAKLTDLNFVSFVKVFKGRDLPLVISAGIISKDNENIGVKVEIRSDFISPKGIVLKKNRLHFSCIVYLSKNFTKLNDLCNVPNTISDPENIPFDPYTQKDAFINLSGNFDFLKSIQHNDNISAAVHGKILTTKDSVLESFYIPCLLLDGTLRTASMQIIDEQVLPLYVPTKIQEISFSTGLNDWEINNNKNLHLRMISKIDNLEDGLSSDFKVIDNNNNLFLTISGLRVEQIGYMYIKNRGFISLDKYKKLPKPSLMQIKDESEFNRFHPILVPHNFISTKSPSDFKSGFFLTNDKKIATEWPQLGKKDLCYYWGSGLPNSNRFSGWNLTQKNLIQNDSCLLAINFAEIDKNVNNLDFLEILYKWLKNRIGNINRITFIALGAMDSLSMFHPLVGVFSGLIKTVGLELGKPEGALIITDQNFIDDYLLNFTQKSLEVLGSAFLPHFYYQNTAYSWKLKQASNRLTSKYSFVDDSSVVLITGGSRGIGFEIAKKIAMESSAKIIVLGRTKLKDFENDIVNYFPDDGAFNKTRFIADQKKNNPGLKMKEILNNARRLEDAAIIHQNFKNLKSNKVEYYSCDITDTNRVQKIFVEVYNKYRKIDVIVHSAGIEQSKSIQKKEWEEFQKIFNVKIQGYKNIINSIQEPQPSLICNFGSMNSFFGSDGQADYNSANELYNSIGSYNNQVGSITHKTFNWTAWDDIGMVATRSDIADILKKRGYNFLPADTGTRLFFNELNSCSVPNSQILVVANNDLDLWSNTSQLYKTQDYLRFPGSKSKVVEETANKVVVRYSNKDNKSKYLAKHLVDGVPAFPGAYEHMMAFDVLNAKFPEFNFHGFQKVEFLSFLKIPDDKAFDILVTVEVNKIRTGSISGQIKITKDFIHKSGILLVENKLYWQSGFSMGTKENESKIVPIKDGGIESDISHYLDESKIFYKKSMRFLKFKKVFDDGSSYGEIDSSLQELFGDTPIPIAAIDGLGLSINLEKDGRQLCYVSPKFESASYTSDFHRLSASDYKSHTFIVQADKPVSLEKKEKGRQAWLVPKIVLSDENGLVFIEILNITLIEYK